MLVIEIAAQGNGAHQNGNRDLGGIPDGWAKVPAELEAEAKSFLPYIDLTVKNGQITAVAQGTVPEMPEPPIDPTTQLMLAVAELAQTVEADNTANQLAIAELAATLLGGAT